MDEAIVFLANENVSDIPWVKWLETQGPLWVIYALVMVAVVKIVLIFFRWLPTMFEKHCIMLDTATQSMAESANVIKGINDHVESNRNVLKDGHKAISQAAIPACKALMELAPPEKRGVVKEHLDDVIRILSSVR